MGKTSRIVPMTSDQAKTPAGVHAWAKRLTDGLNKELSGGGGIFNVSDYGAVGNGVADDTASIQAAIDAAHAAGGGVVSLPPGTFITTTYLTVYEFITIRGSGRRSTIIKGSHAGGGGATPAENLRNGSILYNAQPINTTTGNHVVVQDIEIGTSNPANEGAALYQQSGDGLLCFDAAFGCKYGIVLDQTEDALIAYCDLGSATAGGAGVWIVNGNSLTPGAVAGATNAITFLECHFNTGAGTYGVIDDGGNQHLFIGGDFNGGINAIRFADTVGTLVSIYAESQSSDILSVNSTNLAGVSVGGNILTITGGFFSAGTGGTSIQGSGSPGQLTISGGYFAGGAGRNPIQGGNLFSAIALLAPNNGTALPFYDAKPVFSLFDAFDNSVVIGVGDSITFEDTAGPAYEAYLDRVVVSDVFQRRVLRFTSLGDIGDWCGSYIFRGNRDAGPLVDAFKITVVGAADAIADVKSAYQVNGVQVVSTRFTRPASPALADVIACLDHHGLWG